jgi:bacillithiol biosynthesis deacetylase BshB1
VTDLRLDLLAFGPHPDDIEIGLGGTIAKHAALGHRVGMCDLTRGEMGSNGTPEQRVAEAEAAREALGAVMRVNLGWPDRQLGTSPDHRRSVVELIRRWRPRAVAVPYWEDRHPDHVASSRLLTEAVFDAGLRRHAPDSEPWRPAWICYYFINDGACPSFVVDVSAQYARKRRALACYESQFGAAGEGAVATRLNSPRFMQLVESRDAQFGALIGAAFAEGIVVREPVERSHLLRELA